MGLFTKQERAVLLALALIISAGSGLHLLHKRSPEVFNYVNLIEGDKLYPKLDVNSATHDELTGVPYIGEYTAKVIIRHRNSTPFTHLHELKDLDGIRLSNYDKFSSYLTVKPGRTE